MTKLNLGMELRNNAELSNNLAALFTLVKNSIPDQGAQMTINIISNPNPNNKVTFYDLFPKIFKPKEIVTKT